MNQAPFDRVKNLAAHAIKTMAESAYGTVTAYLELQPHPLAAEQKYRGIIATMSDNERSTLYNKIWELAKMHDPRIHGPEWGELHAFDNLALLNSAMHRLGLFEASSLHPVQCLPFHFGEGGLGAQYFSLSERAGRDPEPGWIGYINGMGVESLEHAGGDAVAFSDRFLHGNNLHVVYNPTHQRGHNAIGFAQDALRMQAVAGGAISKQAYLLAQLWLDFLNANPERKFLQVAHSEGAVHLDAALRLIVQAGATSLLDRIRILTFCPAHFIHPSTYPGNLQVANFVKEEDRAINPWGTKASSVSQRGHIRIVAHQVRADDGYNNPHDFKSWDFVDASRAEINAFFRTGNIEE